MDPDQQARLVYLALLGIGLLLLALRGGLALARLVRTLIVWGVIIGGVAWVYSAYIEAPANTASVSVSSEAIVLTRGRDGHFHADLEVNGQPLRFMIDTGATEIVLSSEDARAAGIDPGGLLFLGRAQTANGIVRTAPVRLRSLRLGDLTDSNVPATVSEGQMPTSLLGMSWLSRFARIEIEGREMRLIR